MIMAEHDEDSKGAKEDGSEGKNEERKEPSEEKPRARRRSFWDALTLFRKHSSGDLHSRLKTRKILGVGETDNGDIHRSKISQLLGHNEHLYVRFPRGFHIWHLSNVAGIFAQGALLVLAPSKSASFGLLSQVQPLAPDGTFATFNTETLFALRIAGAALLGFGSLLWSQMQTFEFDRAAARAGTLGILLFNGITFLLSLWGTLTGGRWMEEGHFVSLFVRAAITSGCILYLHFLHTTSNSGLRKTSSYKDLSNSVNSVSQIADKKNM